MRYLGDVLFLPFLNFVVQIVGLPSFSGNAPPPLELLAAQMRLALSEAGISDEAIVFLPCSTLHLYR